MKVVVPKNNNEVPRKHIILPLTGSSAQPLDKYNSKSFDLSVQPGTAGAAKYKMTGRILTGTEDLRTKIVWTKDTWTIIEGNDANLLDPRKAIVRTLTTTQTYSIFETAMRELAQIRYDAAMVVARETDRTNGNDAAVTALEGAGVTEHTDDVESALNLTIAENLPYKCLQKVKRYVRRECRKPLDMKVREYATHLKRINRDELPSIPPAGPNQELTADELTEILLYGTPKSWQREMDRQGFDPLAQTYNEVIAFMERIEESEDPQMLDKKPSAKKGNGKSDWKSNNNNKKSGSKHCLLHGDCGHSTDECRHLQNQAKKLKEGHSPDRTSSNGKFGNKSWSRKSAEAKTASTKEINAFIKKAIAKGVAKELHSAERKRKAEESSSGEDEELHMVDLADFNYEEMENLRIKDDGSISV